MTQEEKQLLLQDICARLPYMPKIKIIYQQQGIKGTDEGNVSCDVIEHIVNDLRNGVITHMQIYLRPMSSMIEEEKEELKQISNDYLNEWENTKTPIERWKLDAKVSYKRAVFYNSHHIDWNNLISKGLAIEAPEGMYN